MSSIDEIAASFASPNNSPASTVTAGDYPSGPPAASGESSIDDIAKSFLSAPSRPIQSPVIPPPQGIGVPPQAPAGPTGSYQNKPGDIPVNMKQPDENARPDIAVAAIGGNKTPTGAESADLAKAAFKKGAQGFISAAKGVVSLPFAAEKYGGTPEDEAIIRTPEQKQKIEADKQAAIKGLGLDKASDFFKLTDDEQKTLKETGLVGEALTDAASLVMQLPMYAVPGMALSKVGLLSSMPRIASKFGPEIAQRIIGAVGNIAGFIGVSTVQTGGERGYKEAAKELPKTVAAGAAMELTGGLAGAVPILKPVARTIGAGLGMGAATAVSGGSLQDIEKSFITGAILHGSSELKGGEKPQEVSDAKGIGAQADEGSTGEGVQGEKAEPVRVRGAEKNGVEAEKGEKVKYGDVEVLKDHVDPLTELPNNAITKQVARETKPTELTASLDIDHFKAINDVYGHGEGDRVLKAIGKKINEHLDDVFRGREGGEEFYVNHGEVEPNEDLINRYKTLQSDIAESIKLPDGSPVTISIGLSKGTRLTSDNVPHPNSDHALYKAKDSGRNQIAVDDGKSVDYYTGTDVGERPYLAQFARKQVPAYVKLLLQNGAIDEATANRIIEEVGRSKTAAETERPGVSEQPPAEPEDKPVEAVTKEKKAVDGTEEEKPFEAETQLIPTVEEKAEDPVPKAEKPAEQPKDAIERTNVLPKDIKYTPQPKEAEHGQEKQEAQSEEGDRNAPLQQQGREEAQVKGEEPSKTAPATVPEKGGVNERLIDRLTDHLKGGKGFKNTRELLDIADDVHGGTVAEGKYTTREAYDALETALNKHIEETGIKGDPKETIKKLNELTTRLPTQTIRTEKQIELQQFSTPPAEAFLATELAGIKEGMKTLEPSAGNGNIATMMKIRGADVHVNEIDEKRQDNLKALGYKPTGVNAEYLNSTLPDEVKPDVVVMNPPFSSTGGRLKAHDTGFGAEHVKQALLRLKEGGRLVAIVGKGMGIGKPKMASWWNGIMLKYNVRANVGISGKEYVKYGTGFDNNIIVIDKTGPTKRTAGVPVGLVGGEDLTVEQAYDKLKNLSQEDVYGRIKEPTGTGETKASEGVSPGGKEVPGVGAGVSNAVKRGGRRPEAGERDRAEQEGVGAVRVDKEPGAGEAGKVVSEGIRERPGEPVEPEGKRSGESGDVGDGRVGGTDTGVRDVQLKKSEKATAIEEEQGGVYSKYKVKKAVYEGAKPHPAKISESTVMASVEPPDVTYRLHLPEALIKSGAVSDAQLEAMTYAGQTHEQRNVDGTRKEFLLGDGTGMGKMRTILGIISDNFRQGRKKAVIITKKRDLVHQMKNDMKAMGLNYSVIEQGKFKLGDKIDAKDGILFSTYSTASKNIDTDSQRYNQIKDWLGDKFDGAIVFDESHSMKNVSETGFQGEEGQITKLQEGTAAGMMGVTFKKDLKDARFVNASATAATTATNLGYLTRLGLWGEGTPFKNFISFLNVVKDGGSGMMELLARDMKSAGIYTSRSISYDGVTYETIKHELKENEVKTYDHMADYWANMLKSMEDAAKNCGMGKKGQDIMKQFYATQQRFFLQLMTSFKVDSMLKDADEKIKEGKSPVISLYSTGESSVERAVNDAMANGNDLDAMEFSPKQMMADMVERQFPIHQFEEYTDENGATRTRPVLDPKTGEPLINKENYETRQKMIEEITNLKMPENPLDKIINHFGEGKIAEITGRKKRLVIDASGRRIYKERAIKGISQDKINEHEREAFMDGQKTVAVISGAGSTGFDFHAAKNVKNQRQRVFYALQRSWSADQSQQSEGRVHRSNQVSAPHIADVSTNVASEMRLINANQKRLASLGAITKGGRETLSHGNVKAEDITDQYGEAALSWLYRKEIPRATLRRMNLINKEQNIKAGAETDVDGFLNRIMVLKVAEQNEMFEKFYKRYQGLVEDAKAAGTFDVGVEKIKGKHIKVIGEPEVLHSNKETGVDTKLVTLEVMRPTTKEAFEDREEKLGSEGYTVIQSNSKKPYFAKSLPDGIVDVYGPRGHHERFDSRYEFREKYEEADADEVKKKWNEELKKIPDEEPHRTTIVTGSILPVYDKIFFGEERKRVVKQAMLDDGTSHIGIEVPPKSIPKIKQNFGIGSKLYEASPQEILDLVKGDSIIELDNGWKITERKVQGEKRIEIEAGDNQMSEAEMKRHGVFSETISWNKRFFIPSEEEKALESLKSIMETHKPVRDASATGQTEAAFAFERKPQYTFKDAGYKSQDDFNKHFEEKSLKEHNETEDEFLRRSYCSGLLGGRNNFSVRG